MKAAVKMIVLAAMAVGLVHAEAVNFVAGVWTIPPGFSAHNTNVYLRDMTLVPVASSNGLYGINTTGSATQAPTTNDAAGYADVANGENKSTVAPGFVGQKNLLTGTPVPGDGEFLYAIGGAAGKKGYCRVYSAMQATNAAYYVNSPMLYALAAAALNKSIGGNMVVDTINPAYKGLRFDGFPYKYTSGGDNMISGSVNTTVNGGNNTLSNGAIVVYWRSTSGDAWAALENFTISGNGDFAGKYAGGTEVMVGRAGGVAGAMPNSLLAGAQGPLTPLPEPMLAMAGLAVAAGLLRRR